MPPNAFKPPRPSGTARKTTGVNKKTAGSTSKSTSKSAAGKSNRTQTTAAAATRSTDASRLSAASLARLPSLSPMTDDGLEEDGQRQQDRDGDGDVTDDHFLSDFELPSFTKSKGRVSAGSNEAEETAEEEPGIPQDLVSVMLHELFKNGGKSNTRMTREAVETVGKYVDTFVREAVARAAWEREERGESSGFLEVEDLERLAPQLLLDF